VANSTQPSEYRLKILQKIEEFERMGQFDKDVEDDPPFTKLKPGQIDYSKRKLITRLKNFIATHYSNYFFNKKVRHKQIVIDGYEGIENLKKIKTGAVLTQNHFSPFDGIPIHRVMNKYIKRKHLFTLIREGNYSFPGIYGYFMRNCYTIPLASDFLVLKEMRGAIINALKENNFLLVYSEQSMWWNYRKPKPQKLGAATFAVQNNVPLVPMFITMRDSEFTDGEGLPVQAYTLHILKPIYLDPLKSEKENALEMTKKNEEMVKKCYEDCYHTALVYNRKEGV